MQINPRKRHAKKHAADLLQLLQLLQLIFANLACSKNVLYILYIL